MAHKGQVMGMSEEEMTADDIMDYLESAMVNGWLEDLVKV
jgi:hypothetical protein